MDHFEEFTRQFRIVFDHSPEGKAADELLYHLRQETRSAQEFALEFRTLAAGAGWSDRAPIDHCRCSLREEIHRELACRDTTSGHYEYLVMPYGLMNAPSVFQSFVDEIFRDLHGQGVVV